MFTKYQFFQKEYWKKVIINLIRLITFLCVPKLTNRPTYVLKMTGLKVPYENRNKLNNILRNPKYKL